MFHCGACRHEADATYVEKYGRREWMIGSRVDRCPGGGDCLRAVAEWTGARNGAQLKQEPRPFLARAGASEPGKRNGDPEPLPSPASIDGWHSGLLSNIAALLYLDQRGLSGETIERYRLGWDGDEHSLTVPVYDEGRVVNLLRRRLGDGQPFVVLRGRGSQLYPHLPPGGVLLLAGIFDVLSARQAGLDYALTTTCGASLPEYLVPTLAARPVAVAYDVGEEGAAQRTVERLRAAGSVAWVVPLGELGLSEGGDLNDYFRADGSRAELTKLIRRERQAA